VTARWIASGGRVAWCGLDWEERDDVAQQAVGEKADTVLGIAGNLHRSGPDKGNQRAVSLSLRFCDFGSRI
jgi:hypothetical protein